MKPINKTLTEEVHSLKCRVSVLEHTKKTLREKIVDEGKRCLAYQNTSNIVKSLVDQQEIKRKVGIGFEYNESAGKASNITPIRPSAEERGIPHVLIGAPKPLFITPIAEPLLDSKVVIDHEIRVEDQERELARKEQGLPVQKIIVDNVQCLVDAPVGSFVDPKVIHNFILEFSSII